MTYRPEHASAVAKLHAIVSTPEPRVNAAYLEWKYDRNPYVQRQHFYVAVNKGTVVGMRGFYGSRWEGGGESQIIPCGGDFIIAPSYRHQGLFSAIVRRSCEDLAAAGYPFAFSLSAIPVTRMGSLALGWKAVGPPLGELRRESARHVLVRSAKHWVKRNLVWLDRLRAARRARVQSAHAAGERGGLHFPRAFAHFDCAAASAELSPQIAVEKTAHARAMARLVERLRYNGRLRQQRDESYLVWRYQNPLRDYRFVYAGDGRLEGYLALGAARYGRCRLVSIVDWEASSAAVKRRLLEAALALGSFADVTIFSLGLDDESRQILSELGFEAATGEKAAWTEMSILVKGLGNAPAAQWQLGGRSLTDPANWQFRMIYSDFC